MIETRAVKLPKGGLLELEIMPGFYDRIRSRFGLANNEPVTDDHIRMFIFGAVKCAVDKAEATRSNDVQ